MNSKQLLTELQSMKKRISIFENWIILNDCIQLIIDTVPKISEEEKIRLNNIRLTFLQKNDEEQYAIMCSFNLTQ